MKNNTVPMNLQFFADLPSDPPAGNQTPPSTPSSTAPAQPASASIDYDKIAGIISGKAQATEDSVLKGYFKQQGLSQEEVTQAIRTFKEQKAAQEPDVNALQQQAQQALAAAQQANIEKEAFLLAGELGIDVKTVPYLIKLADTSTAIDAEGKISQENLKAALSKVLEDVPGLKGQTEQQQSGFRQIGTGGQQQQVNQEDALKAAFGIKS